MKSPFSRTLLLAGLCAAASPVAFAQSSVAFTIEGEIEEVICTPKLIWSNQNGTFESNAVKLEKVNLSDLAAQGDTAGDTVLEFKLTGCNMSNAKDKMWIHFISTNVDGAGRIVPTSGTGYVRFEIRDIDASDAVGDVVKVATSHAAAGTAPASGQGGFATLTSYPNRSASKKYNLSYYANQMVDQAGVVSANAEYLVKYY